MAAIGNVARNARRMDVAQADWTIGARYVLDTLVAVVAQLYRQAHVANLAVEEIAAAAQPTDATAMAMVLVLVLVVKQIADQARVLRIANS